ncbi:MAG: hypothetical protein AAGA67_02755, partial [Cyanobacteria bacterium P01_F01_bin.153]
IALKDFSLSSREGVGSYVADMQLHMTLQAKNLLPAQGEENKALDDLLREAQEVSEKLASRQRS